MFFERLPDFIGSHPILSAAFVGLSVAIVATEIARFTRGFRGLSPAQLTELVNREDALVVDVSSAADYERGHIVGAHHVALGQFNPESRLLSRARERPIAVVCRTGATSGGAARRLAKAGFQRVYSLDGGIAAWQQADLPLARGREKHRDRPAKIDKPGRAGKAKA